MLVQADGEQHRDPHETIIAHIGGRSVTVELTAHAIQRFAHRGITIADMIACLESPDYTDLPADPGCKHIGKDIQYGRTLEVIYAEIGKDLITVITAYRNSEGRRGA